MDATDLLVGSSSLSKRKMSMRPRSPHTWTSSCSANIMKVSLPQLWQVCVGRLPSSTPFSEFRILHCNICWSTSPTVLLLCSLPVFFLNHQAFTRLHTADQDLKEEWCEFLDSQWDLVGASVSEPHTSELNCDFLYMYYYLSYVVP